jgi:hypothetical protein
MTECVPGCGRCCDPVVTWFDPNGEMNGPSAPFVREHWRVRETGVNAQNRQWWFSDCDRFDPTTRRCLAHDERPPICSGYPWYGGRNSVRQEPHPLDPGCAFNEDVPGLLLPLFVVNRDSR